MVTGLKDVDRYLTHGTNKQIFYKVYTAWRTLRLAPLKRLLKKPPNLMPSGKQSYLYWMKRITSIDAVRGFVMLVMAIDHMRDLVHISALTQDPLDLKTTTFLFLLLAGSHHVRT